MHPGMTPSHPGAATPGHDNAWVPVMATPAHPSSDAGGHSSAWEPATSVPRHPASDSAWDPARSSAAPTSISTGRRSGWDQGNAQYSPPLTSIPKAGKRPAVVSPECSEAKIRWSQHAGICILNELVHGSAGIVNRRAFFWNSSVSCMVVMGGSQGHGGVVAVARKS
jgi:hypothetical protein